jgi:hypothetical protein
MPKKNKVRETKEVCMRKTAKHDIQRKKLEKIS